LLQTNFTGSQFLDSISTKQLSAVLSGLVFCKASQPNMPTLDNRSYREQFNTSQLALSFSQTLRPTAEAFAKAMTSVEAAVVGSSWHFGLYGGSLTRYGRPPIRT
jgi:hypothetical protein